MKGLQFDPIDFKPKRFGLRYQPPQIVIEYLVPSKNKLYHHKIKLPKLKHDSNLEEAMKEIYDKHNSYLDIKFIPQSQILKLVEKLKSNIRQKNHIESNEDSSNLDNSKLLNFA